MRAPHRLAAPVRDAAALHRLPRGVRRFQRAARREAARLGDRWSLESAARPDDLALLLGLAARRRRIAELGTASAWTTISLALDDEAVRVVSFDPTVQPHRQAYLALAPPEVVARITFVAAPGASGPGAWGAVDFLFVDASHTRADTLAEFAAWRPALAPGAVVAFHDYGHPDFPGVAAAIEELGLAGESRHGTFVWRAP